MEKVEILNAVDIINDNVVDYEGLRPFLSTGDLNISTITNLEYLSFLDKPSRANQNVKFGDVLLARMQGTTKVKIVNENEINIIVSTGFLVLRMKENVSAKFIFHLLRSNFFQTEKDKLCSGSTQKAINNSSFSKLKIPLPPLPQQQKIANILDAADAIRQNDKALIAKYDELTQALFLDMFGDPVSNPKEWEILKLSQLSDITSSRRIFKDEYVENGIPFYRTKEIVELSKNKKISSELFISIERYNEIKSNNDIPIIGDILLSAVGTIGVMWVVNNNDPFYFKDGNLVWLKMSKSKNINSKYLRMTLEYLIEHEKGNLAQGAAYNALTIDKLKKFDVNIAPIQLQNQFAERVAVIEEQKAIAQKSLEKSESLFNSLLQKAFKGELV
jgi:type I restriction enzyme S subunit